MAQLFWIALSTLFMMVAATAASGEAPVLRPSIGLDTSPAISNCADQPDPLAVTIRVRDTADVPDDVLIKAQGDVTRIYREVGVETRWATPDSLSGEPDAVRQAALTVALLTVEQVERIRTAVGTDRLGFVARNPDGDARVAFVVYGRVERVTGASRLHRPELLAIVMAHEIGHLLLPYKAHSHAGVMRADWSDADLRRAQRRPISFTTEEGRLLRSRILASQQPMTSDRTQSSVCGTRQTAYKPIATTREAAHAFMMSMNLANWSRV